MRLGIGGQPLAVPRLAALGPYSVEGGTAHALSVADHLGFDLTFEGFDRRLGGLGLVGELRFDLLEAGLDLRRQDLVDQLLLVFLQRLQLTVELRKAIEFLADGEHRKSLLWRAAGTPAIRWRPAGETARWRGRTSPL